MRDQLTPPGKTLPIPVPPFCPAVDETLAREGDQVEIELISGGSLSGAIRGFDEVQGEVSLQAKGEVKGLKRLSLSGIRALRIPRPHPCIRSEVADGLTLPEREQRYTITFNDGQHLEGRTVGVRTNAGGIWMYPAEPDDCFSYAFFPHEAISDYSLGSRIGDLLVEERVLSGEQLQGALAEQEKMRQRPLGEYLTALAVVSGEELEHALRHQRTMPQMRLGDVLLGEGLVTAPQIEEALAAQQKDRKRPLGEILVSMGAVSTVNIQKCLARKLGIPFVNLRKYPIEPAALAHLTAELAHQSRVIPVSVIDSRLVVAVENPLSWAPLEAVRFHAKCHVEPVMALREDIDWAIDHYYDADGRFEADEEEVDFGFSAGDEGDEDHMSPEEQAITDNVVVKLVNRIIVDAWRRGASDIHIEPFPGRQKTLIRFRKDGTLLNYKEVPGQYRAAIVSRIKIMAGLDISDRRKPQDGKIDFKKFGPAKIELRVATIPTAGGIEDVVMRILTAGKPIPVDGLALRPENHRRLLETIAKPYGIFLVCGPTGSGKTTTLHSILGHLNNGEKKIWTAEDPIEITQPGLRQVQVNPRIDFTFATAMRAFLRADPDVIMVGEMRDEETTKIGIEASLTGHLVFATLHTNSAPESVVRLLDMGMDPFNFADALLGVLAQRLAKRLCPDCRQAYEPSKQEIDDLVLEYCIDAPLDPKQILAHWRKEIAEKGRFTFYRPAGCDKCDGTGYRGRFGVHELLVGSPAIRKAVITRAPVSEIFNIAINEGMTTLKQDGIEKVLTGLTDMTQIRAVCMR